MRKQRFKKMAAAFLTCIMMVSCFMVNVYAASELEEIIVPSYHFTTETETEVTATSQVLVRGAYLSGGTVSLGNNGGGSISIYGSTSAYHTCDMLYLNIYLDRSTNGSSWTNYKTWNYSKENASSLTKSFNTTVPTGYYYRLRGYHAAKEGSTKESTSTSTSGKYIS